MRERVSACRLLTRARQLYDAPDSPLAISAPAAWRGEFASGARWMRTALGALRQVEPVPADFQWLGIVKYTLAAGAAAGWLTLGVLLRWPVLAALFPLIFYIVEAQMVFLFPLALDGQPMLFRASRRYTAAAGGTLAVICVVIPLAATMLLGGFAGRGFVRSWSLGCLAVCIWYEILRREDESQDAVKKPFHNRRGMGGPPMSCAKKHRRVARATDIEITSDFTPLSIKSEPAETAIDNGRAQAVGPIPRVPVRVAKPFIFQFGAFGSLCVRHERVALGLDHPIRLLYASDLHLGRWWSNPVSWQLVDAATRAKPDAIILGGDLADTVAGLRHLNWCVARLVPTAPVYALPGNHDRSPGIERVRLAVESAGGAWMPDTSPNAYSHRDRRLHLAADVTQAMPSGQIGILLAHDPAVFPAAIGAGYRLTLAGHLHGGQCVLATHGGKLYPGAWFARWTGLRFQDGDATMIVSRGAADTFPFRWNCPREVIVCDVE